MGPGQPKSGHAYQTAKALAEQLGDTPPQKISAAHLIDFQAEIRKRKYSPATNASRAKSLRRVLRWLWENHGAPKLDNHVQQCPTPRPRNVTVSERERNAILNNTQPHMQLWLLLCNDLAMRSGTAIQIGPRQYDPERKTVSFVTKCNEHLTLPVTKAIQDLFELCDHNTGQSYVRQLWVKDHLREKVCRPLSTMQVGVLRRQFIQIRKSLGIEREIRPHDFRRTTAVAMLRFSQDVREVQALLGHKNLQSTYWYLDHDARPIKRTTLELIKSPEWRKEQAG